MLCLRCIRTGFATARTALTAQQPFTNHGKTTLLNRITQQSRGLALFTSPLTRPTIARAHLVTPINNDSPASALATGSTQTSIIQSRGAKRDTYKPSHVKRKRRLGFLSRLRSRTGRAILGRRFAKQRTAMTH